MDPVEKMLAIVSCEQAIHRFYTALDASDMEAVSAAMAEHGVWYRQGQALRGPGEVSAALAVRPSGRTTAHLVQNMVVDVASPTLARVDYMTLVYRHDAPEPTSEVAPLHVPLSISVHEELLECDGQGNWLVLEKRSRRKFAS